MRRKSISVCRKGYEGKSLALAAMLSCSITLSIAQSGPSGSVRLYRPKDLFCSALKAKVIVDDSLTFRVTNGGSLDLNLSPGKHRVRTRRSTIDVQVTSGSTTYVRTFFEFNFLFGRAMVVEVSQASAISEATRMRKLD